MSEHGELVEELLKEECSTCKDHFEREDCLSRQEDYCRTRMEKILTHILSAVRDGGLDEELGVVGRESVKTIVDAWLDEMILMGATDFIALRKEEG